MKKLKFLIPILALLLCVGLWWSGSGEVDGAGMGVCCIRPTALLSDNFNDFDPNGEEWDNKGTPWSEINASTDLWIGNNTVYQSGGEAGMMDTSAGDGSDSDDIQRTFTAQTTGYLTVEVRIACADYDYVHSEVIALWMLDPGVKDIIRMKISNGDIQYDDNVTYRTVGSLTADNTFAIIAMEINLDASTPGQDCVEVWVNGNQHGTNCNSSNPCDAYSQVDPDNIEAFKFRNYFSPTVDCYVDDLDIYSGRYCPNPSR